MSFKVIVKSKDWSFEQRFTDLTEAWVKAECMRKEYEGCTVEIQKENVDENYSRIS